MEDLIARYIPNAPKLGLYVRPSIPAKLCRNAIRDYADGVAKRDVLALYDNTWLGNGKDGILFTRNHLIFQNSDFDQPQRIRYGDIVDASMKYKRLGGAILHLAVNTGNATFTVDVDFGAHPKALEYVHRFIQEFMLADFMAEDVEAESTDWSAVRAALQRLRDTGELTQEDFKRLMACRQ